MTTPENLIHAADRLSYKLAQSWCSELFRQFGLCLAEETSPSALNRNLAALPNRILFFEQLDSIYRSKKEITSDNLLQYFGVDGLRRQRKVVSFLKSHLSLDESNPVTLEMSAFWARVESMRSQLPESRQTTFEEYVDFLVNQSAEQAKPLAINTLRVYLGAAKRLLEFGHTEYREPGWPPSTKTVERFNARHPGHFASLGPFLSFCDMERLKKKRVTPKALSPAETAAKLFDVIKTTSGHELRCALAALIGFVFDLNLRDACSLESEGFDSSKSTIQLSSSETVDIHPVIARGVSRVNLQTKHDSNWLIPGVKEQGHVHINNVTEYLRDNYGCSYAALRKYMRHAVEKFRYLS